ncbi:MAG: hypothetical protein KF768_10835 [Phycisphaeraceae bacterium]|nr:hypothetical protein [Phycisphaeraceae bacterium]
MAEDRTGRDGQRARERGGVRLSAHRPGTVLVALVIVLVVMSIAVAAIVTTGARDQELGAVRAQGAWAQFAAESAAAMAAKELIDDTDHDGDGGIGTISNDGNPANDPTINGGTRVWATRTDDGSATVITAIAQNGGARREVRVTAALGSAEGGGSGGSALVFTRNSPRVVQRSDFTGDSGTWSTPTTIGTTSNEPMWVSVADLPHGRLVLASDSGNRLLFGVTDGATGSTTFSTICNDTGRSTSRPFHGAALPVSGNGLIIYFDKPSTQMRYRTVSGSTVSGASSMGMSTGDVTWARLVSLGSATDQMMAIIVDSNKRAYAARWTGSDWADRMTLTTSLYNGDNEEAFAALERVSGRLVAAFSHGSQSRFGYRVYTPGSGWSSTSYVTGLGARSSWIRMASRPGTNEIYLACVTSNGILRTTRWNGSSWSNTQNLTSSTGSESVRGFDIVCSPDGSVTRVVYGKGGSTIFGRVWGGSSFGGESTAFTLASGSARTVLAAPGPSGASILVAAGDSNGGVNAWSHNGTTSGTTSRLSTTTSSYANHHWFDLVSSPGDGGTGGAQITGWSQREPG